MNLETMTYAAAGVDIETGDLKVEDMKPMAQSTYRPGVLEGIGGFASLFALNDMGEKLDDPVLVSGTDGVGTKLLVAIMAGRYRGLGQDLVGMCVNDVLTCGAKPIFFLDYFATSALSQSPLLEVVSGIALACKSIGCALVGGETAELPGLYSRHHFDLAGFCVGVVNRPQIIDGLKVKPGDAIIGLASSGLHSNGYALARRVVFDKMGLSIDAVADALLEPTRLYVNPVLGLLKDRVPILAMAHITGGGLVGNVPRTLPAGLTARIDWQSFERPAIFKLLQENGPIDEEEMRRVFNLGIGFTLVVPKEESHSVVRILTAMGESAMIIGEVIQEG
jgi:phosphoribosylformylglycinamidine cyclo-ligase